MYCCCSNLYCEGADDDSWTEVVLNKEVAGLVSGLTVSVLACLPAALKIVMSLDALALDGLQS